MKKQKRIVTGLILAAMLTQTACGDLSDSSGITDSLNSDVVSSNAENTDMSPLYEMEKKDYGEREFRISVNQRYTDEMWVEEETGDICNDAVYDRNVKVEDYFNVTIKTVISADEQTQLSDISKNIAAGDDVYELTAVYTYLAGGPVLEGCYYNWKDIPVVDFSRDWWVADANEAFNIKGNQFVAVGDLSITTLLLSYAVFFNQRIAEEYKFPDLYQTVIDGNWTIDEMIRLTKDMYQDLNNDGQLDKNDFYGFGGDKATNLDNWTVGFDIPLISKNESGEPVVDIDLDRMQTALEKLNMLFWDNNSFMSWGDEIELFANGNSAFITTWINNAFTTFRSMEDDYGIIPYPKFDEEQESYYSNAMDNYSLLSVPKTVRDIEFVGTITEALTRENHFSVVPAYYDVALGSKYARDEQSIAMLDIIMEGRRYDFSILHSSVLEDLPYMFRETVRVAGDNIVSKYATIESKVKEGLKTLVEKYEELGK